MAHLQNVDAPAKIAEESKETTAIWNDLNRLQTDFCMPQELSVYYNSLHWINSTTVLDIGTGNGYYLDKLADRFPEKTFLGIDNAPDLVKLAKKNTTSKNITFGVEDLDSMSGTYNFVIMRLLLQHLSDPLKAMKKVYAVTRPNSCCLIIDAFDELRLFHPPFSGFVEFFQQFISATAGQGLDRNIVEHMIPELERGGKWTILNNLTLTIPSSWPGNLELFYKTYTRVIDLIETKKLFEWDFDGLRDSWKRWSENKNAYAQVGLRILLLQRNA